eukprot:m.33414 g.33414  ORF g.33414 m.33414 type:complete len:78 (+) comp14231_c0_seq2:179-412(+)
MSGLTLLDCGNKVLPANIDFDTDDAFFSRTGVLYADNGCIAAANGACFFADAPHVPTTTATGTPRAASTDTFVHLQR